ncbi:hypothetical protein BD626DRAFT_484872 [Schizophyllum amplum]|uniref:Uncharacterized protein n=1 Tax=Schizophyllum amplum TaxID=97359 RepID=A0A550CQU5_9AGAR|nr:hypothetical protein BD626DRAFT_484872 [Auriculariopsis ampla]
MALSPQQIEQQGWLATAAAYRVSRPRVDNSAVHPSSGVQSSLPGTQGHLFSGGAPSYSPSSADGYPSASPAIGLPSSDASGYSSFGDLSFTDAGPHSVSTTSLRPSANAANHSPAGAIAHSSSALHLHGTGASDNHNLPSMTLGAPQMPSLGEQGRAVITAVPGTRDKRAPRDTRQRIEDLSRDQYVQSFDDFIVNCAACETSIALSHKKAYDDYHWRGHKDKCYGILTEEKRNASVNTRMLSRDVALASLERPSIGAVATSSPTMPAHSPRQPARNSQPSTLGVPQMAPADAQLRAAVPDTPVSKSKRQYRDVCKRIDDFSKDPYIQSFNAHSFVCAACEGSYSLRTKIPYGDAHWRQHRAKCRETLTDEQRRMGEKTRMQSRDEALAYVEAHGLC